MTDLGAALRHLADAVQDLVTVAPIEAVY